MHDFAELRNAVPKGEVLTPGDAGYEASLKRWSAAIEKSAAVVVKPTCVEEVSEAIKFAVARDVSLTVCGGGHSSSGASSSEGMVIDMSKMRGVSVDADSMTVSFDGGCLWEDVDKALERYELATVGGVVNHTGVGGLILGGGHGWLTALHGLTIDNLLSAQVVLANGSVVEVSAERNSDLFWAIRGAGAQFGVVTRFVSRVHKQAKVWSGTLAFAPEKLPELLDVANDFHDKDNRDGHCLAIGIGYAPDGVTHGISAIPLYHGPAAEAEEFFSRLVSMETQARDTSMMSTASVNTLMNPLFEHGMRRLMGSGNVTMPLDAAALQQTADTFWTFCDAHGLGTSVLALELFPTHQTQTVPLTATAYANRGPYYDAVTTFGWHDAALDGDVRVFNRELCEQIRQSNGYAAGWRAGGEAPVGKYINIEAEPVAPEDAYGVNLPRLRELKARYDPGNVFHKWHGIGG